LCNKFKPILKMKKIYLMALTAAFTMSVNAQTKLRIKNSSPRSANVISNSVSKNGTPNSVQQVYGTLVCNTQYIAGTTMDLVFKFTQTVDNGEWIDMFSITFPAGITPTGAPNTSDPFPSANSGDPAGVTTATLNPVSGQTISWGAAIQSQWGAISTDLGVGVDFTVNVTIDPGVVGTQAASFTATGDTYVTTGNPVPGDLNGTVNIYDTPISNMFTRFVQPYGGGYTGLHNCSMTTSSVVARYINQGTATESNIPLNYSINGVAGVAGMYPGPLVPGDSITIVLGTYDFSANDIYMMKAWSEVATDIDMNNDTAFVTISNSNSVPLTSATYSNGIESTYEYGSINRTWSGSGLPFDVDNADFHSGSYSLSWTIPVGAPTNTYTAINVLPCVDVVSGEKYKISFWKRTLAGYVGQTAITTGTINSTIGTVVVLKAYSASIITPGAAWEKDSVEYTATVTGTRYFSIRGRGAVTATEGANVFIDDIMIEKVVLPTGIKINSAVEAIAIFPNPTSGILNVTAIEVNSSIEVFNVIGEKVYSGNLVKGNNSIDLSVLSNGAYFVKMNSNNQIITKKVVLAK
jgi:hypothetical protein